MRRTYFAATAALVTMAATAQPGSHNPAVKNSAVGKVAMPATGANSFTQDQARGRIEKAGYSGVSNLAKDTHGVWRGMATRDGRKVHVGLDFKGNVSTH